MKKLICSLCFVPLLFGIVFSQKISVEELVKIMNDKNVVIIDARGPSDYSKTHITGAINLDPSLLSNKTPIDGILKDVNTLAKIFGEHGISNSSKVVLYCETGIRASRVYWVLKYLGHKDVSLLDGNFAAWIAARKPITKVKTEPVKTTFTPAVNSSIFADKDYVKSKLNNPGTILVDTRKKEDFDAGHIGNAVNIPSGDLLVNKTKIKPLDQLTAIFNNAGVTKDKEIILYCATGVTSSLAYFILTSELKYPNVKLYDGSYNEWSAK